MSATITSRFARDLVTPELDIVALIERGVRVITASGDYLTETDDSMKVAMRQDRRHLRPA